MPTISKNQKTFLDTCETGESNTSRIYRIQIISRGNIFIKVAYLRATLHSCFSIVYRAKRQVHIAVHVMCTTWAIYGMEFRVGFLLYRQTITARQPNLGYYLIHRQWKKIWIHNFQYLCENECKHLNRYVNSALHFLAPTI